MAALARLGLADAVMASGSVVGRRRVFDDRGRQLIDYDEAGFWGNVAPPVALHRHDMHRILAEGAADVPIRFGQTAAGIEDTPDGATVDFADGSTATFDLMIGADGIHSWTRTAVLEGPPARYVGQVGWRYVVDAFPGIDGWNGWLGRDRGFLALGIGGDRVYCVGDLRSDSPEDPTGGERAAFAQLFDGYPEPVPSLLAGLGSNDDLWFSPFEEVVLPSWSRGHVVVIGDAAHATAPNMAEGASLAMEDALVLAESLANGPDVPASLAAFAARRQPRVGFVQHMTHRRDRLRYLHPALRRGVMGVLGHRLFRAHYRPLLAPP